MIISAVERTRWQAYWKKIKSREEQRKKKRQRGKRSEMEEMGKLLKELKGLWRDGWWENRAREVVMR